MATLEGAVYSGGVLTATVGSMAAVRTDLLEPL